LGHDPGYPHAQNLRVKQLGTESEKSSQQPAKEGGSAEGCFCASRDHLIATSGKKFLFGRGKRRTVRDLIGPEEDESAQRMDLFSTPPHSLHNIWDGISFHPGKAQIPSLVLLEK
jgi:hypothetical protein